MKIYATIFDDLVSPERLFEAWYEFRKGKTQREDVQEFGRHIERHIFQLHRDLVSGRYRHAPYKSFFVHDPKRRHIRKACVRDRLVHQTLYTTLRQIYEPRFIAAVYSNRLGKGTHRAVDDLRREVRRVSRNLTRPCWTLKCDVKRFYDSVDQQVLLSILKRNIDDERAVKLLQHVIESFHIEGALGKGVPIGNLTSQIFTNIYLNEFDQFVKQNLRIKHYLRFADDCLFLSHRRDELQRLVPRIEDFLSRTLQVSLHPQKIIIRPLQHGIDYLGVVTLPYSRVLRASTRKRMMRKLRERHAALFAGEVLNLASFNQSLQSYLGILSHTDSYRLTQDVRHCFSWKGY